MGWLCDSRPGCWRGGAGLSTASDWARPVTSTTSLLVGAADVPRPTKSQGTKHPGASKAASAARQPGQQHARHTAQPGGPPPHLCLQLRLACLLPLQLRRRRLQLLYQVGRLHSNRAQNGMLSAAKSSMLSMAQHSMPPPAAKRGGRPAQQQGATQQGATQHAHRRAAWHGTARHSLACHSVASMAGWPAGWLAAAAVLGRCHTGRRAQRPGDGPTEHTRAQLRVAPSLR